MQPLIQAAWTMLDHDLGHAWQFGSLILTIITILKLELLVLEWNEQYLPVGFHRSHDTWQNEAELCSVTLGIVMIHCWYICTETGTNVDFFISLSTLSLSSMDLAINNMCVCVRACVCVSTCTFITLSTLQNPSDKHIAYFNQNGWF